MEFRCVFRYVFPNLRLVIGAVSPGKKILSLPSSDRILDR